MTEQESREVAIDATRPSIANTDLDHGNLTHASKTSSGHLAKAADQSLRSLVVPDRVIDGEDLGDSK